MHLYGHCSNHIVGTAKLLAQFYGKFCGDGTIVMAILYGLHYCLATEVRNIFKVTPCVDQVYKSECPDLVTPMILLANDLYT